VCAGERRGLCCSCGVVEGMMADGCGGVLVGLDQTSRVPPVSPRGSARLVSAAGWAVEKLILCLPTTCYCYRLCCCVHSLTYWTMCELGRNQWCKVGPCGSVGKRCSDFGGAVDACGSFSTTNPEGRNRSVLIVKGYGPYRPSYPLPGPFARSWTHGILPFFCGVS
jgi:hypothetical protein